MDYEATTNPEEPHDGSGRVEKWNEILGEWMWNATYLDADHARQNLATLRAAFPRERYRMAPPGTKGYSDKRRRIEAPAEDGNAA